MKLKKIKKIFFIACLFVGCLSMMSFYNFVLSFPNISTVKTARYNTRRSTYYSLLKSKPNRFHVKTEDNIDICGFVIDRPQSNKVLMVCHGYKQSKEHLSVLANLFNDYTLVLFDLRGHGDSSGSLISFGYHEYKDVCAIMNFLRNDSRFTDKKIYGLGISMGAASIAHAASKGCKFDGLILDSFFSVIDFEVVNKFIKVPWLFFNTGKAWIRWFLGIDIDSIRPDVFLSKVDCPLMIIHSEADEKVSVKHAKELYDKARTKNKLLVMCNGSHGRIFKDDADSYRNVITDFVSKI